MIEFNDVTKTFGDNVVLNHLNLLIPSGKITFIVGKSGDGKTVLLKHIIGLLRPDSGRIIVDGDDITDFTDEQLLVYRCKLGILFQSAALFDGMTVGENVIFPLQEHTKMLLPAMLARAEEVLIKVGLPNYQYKYTQDLTTEQKKRVGLA
ncbi:MAG: ATP-binding cassette domain-containing protein, partial [Proteobacteria bacterium]|nr:ATP-binding cassette domain-containing protein [Pseudomonadota bacterium]